MTNKYSIYKNTINDGFEMKYYDPILIPYDEQTDYEFTVPEAYHQKPGNLAYELYGTPKLYWIFAYFNPNLVQDPIFDIKAGMTLIIPSKQRLMSYF